MVASTIASIIAALVSAYGSTKISNKINKNAQGKQTINQRMQGLNKNGNSSDISGIRGNLGPEGGPVQFPMYSPEQMGNQQKVGQMGIEGLQQNPFDFGPIKAATMDDYYTHFMPQLMEKFAGLGGNQNSSGFLNSLTESGEALNTKLAAMQQDYRSQAGDRYLKMFDQGNKPQYENMLLSPQPSAGRNALNKAFEYGAPMLATLGSASMQYAGQKKLANSLQEQRQNAAPMNTKLNQNYNFLRKG